MTRAEAVGVLKEYAEFQKIENILVSIVEYAPGERTKRGAIQDVIISRLDCNGNNHIRNLISKVLRIKGCPSIKYQGDRCYKNVKLRG